LITSDVECKFTVYFLYEEKLIWRKRNGEVCFVLVSSKKRYFIFLEMIDKNFNFEKKSIGLSCYFVLTPNPLEGAVTLRNEQIFLISHPYSSHLGEVRRG
jgi:hypothetical protein